MSNELKLRKIGNSLGVVLPKETLSTLRVQEGDVLYLTEAPDGYRVTNHNPDFAASVAVFESLAQRYRNALHELAK